jgi:hypothetical protein
MFSMTSSTFPAFRLSAAIARTGGVRTPASPRHRAPENPDAPPRIVPAGPELHRVGRHAEPEWFREQFDPQRDVDPFDWLGFAAAQE